MLECYDDLQGVDIMVYVYDELEIVNRDIADIKVTLKFAACLKPEDIYRAGYNPKDVIQFYHVGIVPEESTAILAVPEGVRVEDYLRNPLPYQYEYVRLLELYETKARLEGNHELASKLASKRLRLDSGDLLKPPFSDRDTVTVECEMTWIHFDSQWSPPYSLYVRKMPSEQEVPVVTRVHRVKGRACDIRRVQEALTVFSLENALATAAWHDSSIHPTIVRSLLGKISPKCAIEYLKYPMSAQLDVIKCEKDLPYIADWLINAGAFMLAEAVGHNVQSIVEAAREACRGREVPHRPFRHRYTFKNSVEVDNRRYSPYMYTNLAISSALSAVLHKDFAAVKDMMSCNPSVMYTLEPLAESCSPLREILQEFLNLRGF